MSDEENPIESWFNQMKEQHEKKEHKMEGRRLQTFGVLFGEDRETLNTRVMDVALDNLAIELSKYLQGCLSDDRDVQLAMLAKVRELIDFCRKHYDKKLIDIKTGYVSYGLLPSLRPFCEK